MKRQDGISLTYTAEKISLNNRIIPVPVSLPGMNLIKSRKTSVLLILIGCALILICLVATINPAALLSGPGSQPETLCIGKAHQQGLTTFWDAVVAKANPDPGTVALGHLDIGIFPQDSIEKISMSFTAKKQGHDVVYFAGFRNRSPGCGTLDVHGGAANQPNPVEQFPQDPRKFFEDIEAISFGELGLVNESVSVSTDNVRGSLSYSADPRNCREIFLLENGHLLHLNKISFTDDRISPFPRILYQMRCEETGSSVTCGSERSVEVFSNERLTGAKVIFDTSGLPPTFTSCPAGSQIQYFSKFTSVNFGKSSILSTSDQPNGRRTETNETNLSFFRIPSQTNSRKKSKRNKSSATVLGPR